MNKLQSIILPQVKTLSSKVLKNTVNLSMSVIEKFQAFRFIYSNGLNDFIVDEMDQKTDLLERSLIKSAIKVSILPILISLAPVILLASISIIYIFFSDKNKLISTLGILLISLQRLNTRFVSVAGAYSTLAEFNPRLNRIISFFNTDEFKFKE